MTQRDRSGMTRKESQQPPMVMALLAGFGMLLPGCVSSPNAGVEVTAADAPSVGTENGLRARNGLTEANGLRARNGLTSIAPSADLLNTAEGLSELSYLVKCALPEGRTLVRTDEKGVSHSFAGSIGLAPEWEQRACGQACQEWVSACVLSLVNATGKHVPLWMVADSSAVGFGLNSAYPHQEGSFFGNLFLEHPAAYYCAGRDYSVSPVAGRIGSKESDPSQYSNLYGVGGQCAAHCTPADYPSQSDGYKACSSWNRVVTIWRN